MQVTLTITVIFFDGKPHLPGFFSQQAKEIGKHHAQKYTSEFTFHPRVSSASSRIVENSGMDFLTRQQRHVEKQKKLVTSCLLSSM